jgi:hypothetical protein
VQTPPFRAHGRWLKPEYTRHTGPAQNRRAEGAVILILSAAHSPPGQVQGNNINLNGGPWFDVKAAG